MFWCFENRAQTLNNTSSYRPLLTAACLKMIKGRWRKKYKLPKQSSGFWVRVGSRVVFPYSCPVSWAKLTFRVQKRTSSKISARRRKSRATDRNSTDCAGIDCYTFFKEWREEWVIQSRGSWRSICQTRQLLYQWGFKESWQASDNLSWMVWVNVWQKIPWLLCLWFSHF